MKPFYFIFLMLLGLAVARPAAAQTDDDEDNLPGLAFRSVGPALTSGRIADLAIHPSDKYTWYVAVASGGVWKTTNAGTTFEPIFDHQGSYSIGVVTVDPNNPDVVWVGTGENNNQRSVAYGDGVYKSEDGGENWKKVGLPDSEHIGSIVVDPRNSDVVYVAAHGPLWNAGGDRGLYKTTDGGTTWQRILYVDEHTGVNEVVMHPKNPDILFASTHQRRRHVFTYISGGPGSAIYRSVDGGKNWDKLSEGLPEDVDLGRIGLAISPADPEYIYAIVEAAHGEGGFFMSTNLGATWVKQSDQTTSGNYYQEIVAHPTEPGTVYSMDTYMHVTTDYGKTFERLPEDYKHVDNHCLYIDPDNTDHMIAGCDGGIYETYDRAATWSYFDNLPIVQYYKVSVDQTNTPFYHIFGGTQDNWSHGGPNQTTSANGIRNADWYITNGGDGFETLADPFLPSIVYAQSQYGFLKRFDKKTGQRVDIKPFPGANETEYRWNWDAPLVASQHQEGRIYFAANKLFRSDDRGDSWTTISPDLTAQIDRNSLEVMGRLWSVDAVFKNGSTSPYGTIVALTEHPTRPEVLAVGTDDGLIQITEDGGDTWRKISRIAGVPERTYVNALLFSQHEPDRLFAVFNHHKYGDFRPYVYRSDDLGKSWKSITGDLPERGSTYAIGEDHLDPDLLFVGTEFGVFFTNTGGDTWTQLEAGLPTVAVRDLDIQRHEDDLVLATFGRSFYVLDDYSPLRQLPQAMAAEKGYLFPVDTALSYIPSRDLGAYEKAYQGHSAYMAENPPFGAAISYYLPATWESRLEQRKDAEAARRAQGADVPYASYETLKAEADEQEAYLLFVIENSSGEVVRKLQAPVEESLRRIHWDLRHEEVRTTSLEAETPSKPERSKSYQGALVVPGDYTVTMYRVADGASQAIGSPQAVVVEALNESTLPLADPAEVAAFELQADKLARTYSALADGIGAMQARMKLLRKAAVSVDGPELQLLTQWQNIHEALAVMSTTLNGDPIATKIDQAQLPSLSSRISRVIYSHSYYSGAITGTQREQLAIVKAELQPMISRYRRLVLEDIVALEAALLAAGANYTPGSLPVYDLEK